MATPITPSTNVYLLKCPLELDNNHQLNFASRTAQYNYFSNLPRIEFEDFSYQRKEGIIRVPYHIDSLYEYNYVMYQNENYDDKWFYAFVSGMEYVNDHCTFVKIKTDVWQTWGLDVTFRKCFVEREHVNSDAIGEHTLPEDFELGEFICNARTYKSYASTSDQAYSGNTVLCFQVTKVNVGRTTYPSADYMITTGLPQGCFVFGKVLDEFASATIKDVVTRYDDNGLADSIVSIFLVPKGCCQWDTKWETQDGVNAQEWLVPRDSFSAVTLGSVDLAVNTSLDGYIPKNRKLFTYPYNYLYVTNNSGSDVTYKWEQFQQNQPYFTITGAFEQGGALMLEPVNSKSSDNNAIWGAWNEGILSGKLPTLSWSSDYYLNWQAVNGKNAIVQTALSGMGFGANVLSGLLSSSYQNAYMRETAVQRGYFPDEEQMVSPHAGGLAGSAINLGGEIANIMQAKRQAEMTPPQARGNTATGSLQFCANRCGWTFRKMSIKAEYARKIDDYWTAFGYRVNSYKIPNINGRQNWNYVKCIDVNILADIPQVDLEEIKLLFNSGITIWHNPSTFLDYSQSNNIV